MTTLEIVLLIALVGSLVCNVVYEWRMRCIRVLTEEIKADLKALAPDIETW